MTMQHVHPGGYFQRIDRTAREAAILRAATTRRQIAVISRTDASAMELGQRLALSGMPTIVGQPDDRGDAARAFASDGVSTLVASHEYIVANGPIDAALVIHTRMALTTRQYTRRLGAARAPIHLTFVVPEDERSAETLIVQLSDDAVVSLDGDLDLTEVLDARSDDEPASVAGQRRRFPLVR